MTARQNDPGAKKCVRIITPPGGLSPA
jgi:hypothetical protein